MTLSRGDILELVEANGIQPSKALGQHFVADPNTVRRIARLAELSPREPVVEIGAGLGSLTLALAETGAMVTAVELDRRLVGVLRSVAEPAGARVVEADALSLDWGRLLSCHPRWALVANLPYNVATPLVITLLETVPPISRMLVMVQREAGDRLAAGVGDAAFGSVSVKVAYWASASVVGRVPATVFFPRPRVESVLVRIVRREVPAVTSVGYEQLAELVSAGFAHRRKMLRRALGQLVGDPVFEAAGVRPEARAEELGVEDWGRLAECRRAATAGGRSRS